jgi:hypothetical protein
MKYTYSQSEGAGFIGHGLLKRWVGCVFGLVLFVAAAGSVAQAQSSAMSQGQYLQWMANICGDTLPSANSDDLINWARGKGMNPSGGWQLNAKLTKDVVAQTIVQLLNLAPRKGTFDATRILEREGIILTSGSDGSVTVRNLVALVDSGFGPRVGTAGPRAENPPTETRPGGGKGDKNHEHTGPPGQTGVRPGKGNEKHGR